MDTSAASASARTTPPATDATTLGSRDVTFYSWHRIEPGTHDVEIRDSSGAVLFSQRVFVESELKTVVVH